MSSKIRLRSDEDTKVPPTGVQLKAWRKRNGMTQDGAAGWLGFPVKTYQNWEQGIRPAKYPVVVWRRMDQADQEREKRARRSV